MIRLLTALLIVGCAASQIVAQEQGQAARDQQALARAAENGKPVTAQITVKNGVSVQAVLIPQVDAKQIFGKEIANHYAVIELNVGNKSPDSALIVHGVFIDYSRWGLAGTSGEIANFGPISVDGLNSDRFDQFQTSTSPNHIASEEYRIVRDQLQNSQLWTARSWTMRILTLAASMAGAYPFPISMQGLKELNAFSGVVVPGIEKVWPDPTRDQLNRISDYGYRTNKVIPKESAEIIVCFFPIDRFLTPGFRKLFLRSPALFFAPLQMLVDPTLKGETNKLLKGIDPSLTVDELKPALPCFLHVTRRIREDAYYQRLNLPRDNNENDYVKITDQTCLGQFGLQKNAEGKIDLRASNTDSPGQNNNQSTNSDARKDTSATGAFRKFLALSFLSQMSLNSVTIKVDGAMTLDTSSLAAKVEEVKLDDLPNCGEKSTCFWSDKTTNEGVRTGSITGAYLTNGTVEIVEAKALKITDVKAVPEGSSDQVLNFSYKISDPIPTGTELHIKVTKPALGIASLSTKTLESKVFTVTVPGPKIADVTLAAAAAEPATASTTRTLTIKGTDLSGMTVKLHPPKGADVDLAAMFVEGSSNATQSVYQIPASTLSPGCWRIIATVDKQPVGPHPEKYNFVVLPVVSLTRAAKEIKITGLGLDAKDCAGVGLNYSLVKGEANRKPLNLTSNVDGVKFTLPDDTDSTWSLKVSLGDQSVTKPIPAAP